MNDYKTVIEEAIDVISSADNSSGYCTCGKRIVLHRKTDGHTPIDSGDKQAELVLDKLHKMLQ